MKKRLEDVLSIALTAAAVAIAAVVAWGQFIAEPSQLGIDNSQPGQPEFYDDWVSMVSKGILIGDTAAPIKILEFVDLECYFCSHHYQTHLQEVKERFGATVAVVFIHLPLEGHRFAKLAARAAECAERQGRFAEFVEAVFNEQDSIGHKAWSSYGRDAGIIDSFQYDQCLASDRAFARIDSGLALAQRAAIRSTPTVLVNGWRFPSPPTAHTLSAAIEDLLAGREPSFGRP
jgi:protein-disulfide isomerase